MGEERKEVTGGRVQAIGLAQAWPPLARIPTISKFLLN